jgi:protein kinase A
VSLAHDVSEKKLLSEISFPFIINMYASFKDTKFLYLVLEYSIGGGRTKACR